MRLVYIHIWIYNIKCCFILQYNEIFFEYRIYWVLCAHFDIENDAEIFPAHYTWKEAEKGFKMAFMMNKLAMINA